MRGPTRSTAKSTAKGTAKKTAKRTPGDSSGTTSARGLTLGQLRRRRWVKSRGRAYLAAGAGVLLLALAIWLVYFSSLLAVHNVAVSGEQSVSVAEIEAVAKVPGGTPLIDVDLGQIRDRVQSIPGVLTATVSRSWPQTISIAVVERTPVAVVSTSSGLRDIDASGVIFGHLSSRPAGLPWIRLSGNVDSHALLGAATVAASLPSSFASQVTSISVRTMDDIQLNLTGGRWVRWGNSNDSATKAQVAAALLRLHASHIDVSVPSTATTQ